MAGRDRVAACTWFAGCSGGGPPSRAAARSAAASPSAGVAGRACCGPPPPPPTLLLLCSVLWSSAFDRVERADTTLRTDRGMDGAADAANDGAARAYTCTACGGCCPPSSPYLGGAPPGAPPTAERAERTERPTDPAVRGRGAPT